MGAKNMKIAVKEGQVADCSKMKKVLDHQRVLLLSFKQYQVSRESLEEQHFIRKIRNLNLQIGER